MPRNTDLKPTHKIIKDYYATLELMKQQDVFNELSIRTAFQDLLSGIARKRNWSVIPELAVTSRKGRVIPDATIRDEFFLPRGYWEAKDTKDDIDIEIEKKIKKGYPLSNIIFEDSREGVLFQSGNQLMRVDLANPGQLVDLINAFFDYQAPDFESFEKAVDEFKEKVPELAGGLAQKISEAHKSNKDFIKAFKTFFEICRSSINPNLSAEAVDEMLVQHLLTERLFRTVLDNPEFSRRNIIACEVEKVIGALVSKSFSRKAFLDSLNRFYVAIEDAAKGLDDYAEKQHFLNMIYEKFFQGYSVKTADTHGIVYTPQPIVEFMRSGVEEILNDDFDLSLGNKKVHVLDPCTGTGNFIINILHNLPKRDLDRMYKEQLFANEVMLMPYYISAMNIEHAFYELTGEYEPFDGLCFVDTLDIAEQSQTELALITQENTERVKRQQKAPITVIIGNPPYNVGQINENDNNKNRKYRIIDSRVQETFARDSKASNKNALSDVYVKFFRWAIDRLNGRDGIVCFVSNNSFLDGVAFDGMRKQMSSEFSKIIHLDLHGNVRKNPKLSGTTHNVFGIQVGVGITFAIKKGKSTKCELWYSRVPEFWRKEEKYDFLIENSPSRFTGWKKNKLTRGQDWLILKNKGLFNKFLSLGSKESKSIKGMDSKTIFKSFGRGVATSRDSVVYDFDREVLKERIIQFIEDYNSEIDRWQRTDGKGSIDDFVDYSKVKWSESLKNNLQRGKRILFYEDKIRKSMYRPYSRQFLYFDETLNERRYQFPKIFPNVKSEQENRILCIPGYGNRAEWSALVSNTIVNLSLTSLDAFQCFPYYIYNEDGKQRRENITDWALTQFHDQYKDKKISKWDIFYYVYGVLHHKKYKSAFSECLKKEYPRIPFAPDFNAFWDAGKQLAELHLNYESREPYDLEWIENPDLPLSYEVKDKLRLSSDKKSIIVNDSLTLNGIPPEVYNYRLGNRSALHWIIDQYQVKKDAKTGQVSDPNNREDKEYIVRLIGQVIAVSIKTDSIVKSLPDDCGI
ncbi:MAG: type ISP restriction/modification enzyme [Candidatus Zixiibacteriota bacterium]